MPDPEILRALPDAPIRSSENKEIIGASTPEPSTLPSPARSLHKIDVFEGRQIMLSSDLGIGSHLLGSIEELIKQGGGKMTADVASADMVICRYREGLVYRVASRVNKEVGNLSWLYHLVTYNTWTSPLRRLLHYPVSRTPIPGFRGLRISLSNYVGEARVYLEHLIAAAGAECTKTLKQDNTHLISAHDTSEKCAAAREWGLHVVNHLWLEESYAKWKLQSVSDPRYTHFPKRTNLGEVVGQTRLDKAVIERVFFPAEETPALYSSPSRTLQTKGQNVSAMTAPVLAVTTTAASARNSNPTKQLSEERESKPEANSTDISTPKAKSKPKRPADEKKLLTPAHSRIAAAENKENDTPSTTSSRKSKEAAAARLHEIAPDIALYEKEKRRVGGVIYGGRKRSDENTTKSAISKKRRSTEPQDESEIDEEGNGDTDLRRQKRARPSIVMHLLITGYQRWVGKMKKEDAEKVSLLFCLICFRV